MSQNPSTMSSDHRRTSLSISDQIDVLMAEYGFIKSEMQTYINLFHRHTNILPPLLTAAIAVVMGSLAVLARSNDGQPPTIMDYNVTTLLGIDVAAYQLLGLLGFILITTWGLFSASASLSYIYIIELLARRAETIEREVNRMAGENLLCWEIRISPQLIRLSSAPSVWISPSTFRILWSYIGFFFVTVFMLLVAVPLLGIVLGSAFIVYAVCGVLFEAALYVRYKYKSVPNMIEIVNSAVLEPEDWPSSVPQTDMGSS